MINTKPQMTKLLQAGRLGNTMQTWHCLSDMLESGYQGRWGCRNGVRSSSTIRIYDHPWESLNDKLKEIRSRGLDPERDLYWYEAPPDEYRTIQGELQRSRGELCLRYTFSKRPLRTAFDLNEQCGHTQGIMALAMLDYYAGRDVREELEAILDHFDGHVLEFTGYSKPVGIYGKNYIVWEVRNY